MSDVFVVTASRTADGRRVYLTSDRAFSELLADAHQAPDEATQREPLDWAQRQQFAVCDPYLMRARRLETGELAPVSAREQIRAVGPRWVAERFGYAI